MKCTSAVAFILVLSGALLLPCPDAAAQALTAGAVSGNPGSTVDLPIQFTAGSPVATLQFDLTYASSLSSGTVTAGSAATAAGKGVSGSTIPGGVRIVVFGLNQTVIGSGPIAIVSLSIAAGTPPGSIPVGLSNLAASDPNAYTVPLSGTGGGVTVTQIPDTIPPLISNISCAPITQFTAVVNWTTNEPANSQVEYGTTPAYGSLSGLDPDLTTTHSMNLSGLSPGIQYHFRIRSRDAAGNPAFSADQSFTTATDSDTIPPQITAVISLEVTANSAIISWVTDEAADSQVEYGTTTVYEHSTSINAGMVTTHIQSLSGLNTGVVYHYRVRSRDASGNLATSDDYTFVTIDESDTTPPIIGSVLCSQVTNVSATISWTTNEPASGQVEYGTSLAYGSLTERNANLAAAHQQLLNHLEPTTLYHYRVRAIDAAGNPAVSEDRTFVTLEDADTTPPVISDVTIASVLSTSATIRWQTDENADSQVEYGTTASYGMATVLHPSLQTSHVRILTGLRAQTVYHFRVNSHDMAGNLARSQDFIFTTPESPGDFTPLKTLYYPRLLLSAPDGPESPSQECIGIAIVNLDSKPAVLRFTAYDAMGVQLSGSGITNPILQELSPGMQFPIIDSQLFGDGTSGSGALGWVQIESSVAKVAGFFLGFNSALTELDGVDMSSSPVTAFILPEIEDQGFTRIGIANPNPEPAMLVLQLMLANGTIAATETRNISPNGALIENLFTELFPYLNPDAAAYIRVTSTSSVVPFELLGKPAQYVEGLSGQDAALGATALYCPQYTYGGMWRTTLSVINLDATPGTVTFRYIRDDATQIGATKVRTIAANGKIYIDDPSFFFSFMIGPGDGTTQGHVEITSNGVRLAGSVIFGDPDRSTFSSALPLTTRLEQTMLFSHVASNDQYFTGVAVLNPYPTDISVSVDIYNEDGSLAMTQMIIVPPSQRIARLLEEIFPDLAGQQRASGYFMLTSEQPFAGFALFGTRDLSTLSAIPPQIIR